ncbi:MAG: tRNA (N(6)-L-threonylcarbamoyladenosine(37)-C(2))-methylthiotransferase MtaB [bacterium]|nr:tRNA (N(6)-L-threonylcarbamoyladenosine(37)-C(2))-methylthiotransferase MtaB [bacterium]
MTNEAKSVSFFTQGCRLNIAETAALSQQFESAGYSVTDNKVPGDIVVVNTCTVTENGDSDMKRIVRRVVRQNKEAKIALIGCVAQIQKEALLKLPNVMWVVGNGEKMSLASIIQKSSTNVPQVIAPKMTQSTFVQEHSAIDPGHTRGNLKIQDGCNFYCSFCVIPFARGPARSRQFDDLMRDAESMVASGHRELVLTGVNIGTYEDGSHTFVSVLRALNSLDGLDRIRISSIEPTTIDDAVIEMMANPDSKVCAHLHIPIQSGHDDTLSAMRRKYSLAEFDSFVTDAAKRVPHLGLGTDVIVGFPGETDAHFEHTYQYLASRPFSYFHVFSYSDRKNTIASKMVDKRVPSVVIRERSAMLRDLSKRKRDEYMIGRIGDSVNVLFEQCKSNEWFGTTEDYMRVKVADVTENLKNKIIPVQLLDRQGNGTILSL